MWKRSDSEPAQPADSMPSSQRPQAIVASGSQGSPGDGAVIGPSITIRGDLTGQEDLQVEGRVEGKIDLKQNLVTVGAQGRVKADIYGRLIEVEGEVEGNLFGQEQVIVRRSGSVRGNITAPRVSLEDGANFKGTIDMDPKAAQRKAQAAKQGQAKQGQAGQGQAKQGPGGASGQTSMAGASGHPKPPNVGGKPTPPGGHKR